MLRTLATVLRRTSTRSMSGIVANACAASGVGAPTVHAAMGRDCLNARQAAAACSGVVVFAALKVGVTRRRPEFRVNARTRSNCRGVIRRGSTMTDWRRHAEADGQSSR